MECVNGMVKWAGESRAVGVPQWSEIGVLLGKSIRRALGEPAVYHGPIIKLFQLRQIFYILFNSEIGILPDQICQVMWSSDYFILKGIPFLSVGCICVQNYYFVYSYLVISCYRVYK